MALVTLAQNLAAARAGGYAVGAFNVSDLNQAVAVLAAARAERSPVIVQAIAGLHPYDDEGWWWDRLRELIVSFPDVTATLHLDHGQTVEDCRRAIDHGFTSVMIDASRDPETGEPATFERNVDLTTTVARRAHAAGISVEGELGTVGGAEAGLRGEVEEIVFADPDQAAAFVGATGVDALAVAVGTSHGSVKFVDPGADQRLRIELVAQIAERIPDTFLVLHGSSSIPADAVAVINAHGGQVRPSHGIGVEQKQDAIASGIRKINQGTDSHLSWTAALRRRLAAAPGEVEPSLALRDAMTGMTEIVRLRMREFGSSGRAAGGR
jgi:fructose-bisphosphate aldolase class II